MSKTASKSDQSNMSPVAGRTCMVDVLKGGYGKSTISMNLADRLSTRGNDVLYLDLDPNGHVTEVLGYTDVYYDELNHDYGYVVTNEGYYGKQSLDPESMIYETEWGWDFVPSYDDMEAFETVLRQCNRPTTKISEGFLRPLFDNNIYDYCIIDGGGERSRIADNGFYAGRQAILPIAPGKESASALRKTKRRIIKPLSEKIDNFRVLAVTPNLLSERIDQQTDDRKLIERLNDHASSLLPDYAKYTSEELRDIDQNGAEELPGIRKDGSIKDAIEKGMPVGHYDPKCSQIEHLDELAHIIEVSDI